MAEEVRLHMLAMALSELGRVIPVLHASLFHGANTHINVKTDLEVWDLHIPAGSAEPLAENKNYKNFLASAGQFPFLTITKFSIGCDGQPFPRGLQSLRYEASGGVEATVILAFEGRDNRIGVLEILSKHLTLSTRRAVVEESLSESEKERIRLQERNLQDLKETVARLASSAAHVTTTLADKQVELTANLEKRYEERHARLEEEHSQKRKTLEEAEEELKRKKTAFDLRENTAVRRELFKRMTEEIIAKHQTLTISADASKKRWITHVVCTLVLVAAGVAATSLGHKFAYGEPQFTLYRFVPFSASTLLFGATLFYYIRWNDLWSKAHANAEIANRKFAADVYRASWVAELLFEWRQKIQAELPRELLSSFTRGLFVEPDSHDPHPFDQIATSAARLKKLKCGKSGVEVVMSEEKQEPDKP